MDFLQVDVFADTPYRGNPLAVFPDAGGLTRSQMQAIASEMNLSETTFVTGVSADSYDARIFTPAVEMPFAGHPTIGTAWVLWHLGRVDGDEVWQRSGVGETPVRRRAGEVWFERTGTSSEDLAATQPRSSADIGASLGLDEGAVALEARELGRSGMLRPALADAGIEQLMVPLRNIAALERASPIAPLLAQGPGTDVYCFTAEGAGRVRARGFFPDLGIGEDPATGSAAAALGIYLAGRLGPIRFEVRQGLELKRPSRILVRAEPGRVEVGGRVSLVLNGRLEELP